MKKTLLFLLAVGLSFFSFSQKAQISLPITWDDTTNIDYSVIDFGGDSSLLAADPSNASNIVLKSIKTAGSQVWAGTVLGSDSLAAPIPFSTGNTVMRARVYSPTAGITVRLKVEDETNGAVSVETDATTSVVGWDTLSFDFANNVSGTPAINFSNTYDKVAIFYNFGVSPTSDETYYVDYVEFAGGGSGGTGKALPSLPITWDDTANVDYTAIDFGGNASMLAADPNNASNIVLQSDKTAGAQIWAGTTFGNSLAQPIPFSSGYTSIIARVYSPAAGVTVKMKAEDSTDPTKSVETDVITTTTGWDTLYFDFSNNSSGTPPIDFTTTYDKVSIFYNFGVSPANAETYYVDDVYFDAPPSLAQIDLPISWDDTSNVDYTTVDFGGNASTLAVDPTDPTNNVLQSDKTAGAQVWAGTSFGNSLAQPIPFSAGNTTLIARVYSPNVGIVVKMKVEDATDPTKTVETDVTTTVAGWDTLYFDFSNNTSGTPAIDFTTTYDKASIFYNFGVSPTATETYYVDDVYFDAPLPKSPITLPVNWEDSTNIDYTAIDFGGNVSSLAVDPTNANNVVLQSDKTSGAQIWAGTSFGNSLGQAIPFSSGNTFISARVYSPAAGVTVKMKAEDATDPTKSVETDVVTTQVGWDTLTFDFSNNSAGTPAIDFTTTYDKLSIFYDFGNSPATTTTYYVDNVEFGSMITGLVNITAVKELNMYPNPATNFIVIENTAELKGNVSVEIFNTVGQAVFQSVETFNSSNKIDVSELENGLYIISVQSENERRTTRFFISR